MFPAAPNCTSMPQKLTSSRAIFALVACFAVLVASPAATLAQEPSVASYESIQAAIDANPGKAIFVPPGNYEINAKLRIGKAGGGLYGSGCIIQKNAGQPILQAQDAASLELRGLTFTRAEGQMESMTEGVLLMHCRDARLNSLRVIDNRSPAGSIALRNCEGAIVRDCLVDNYMRISVDDRTASPLYGYAFRCIDGSGIVLLDCLGTLLQGNRVIEHNLLPTPEVKEKFGLGKFTKKNAQKGTLMKQEVWDAEYVNNWHQGSGIVLNNPRVADRTQILGNLIENAAQGIDIHADHVIVANNIINNAFMGMKAMHGSRNVIITGNQFIKNDLWSIGLMPGTASGFAEAAHDGQPAREPNHDGGSIIANNVISDFGYGNAAWIWGGSESCAPMRFDHGPTPGNPPLTDVIVQGNVVYDSGRDEPLVNGVPTKQEPRYKYAVRVEADTPTSPRGLHFVGNILNPGTAGVSNVELTP